MKTYIAPEMEITEFKVEDVIRTSNADLDTGGGQTDPSDE